MENENVDDIMKGITTISQGIFNSLAGFCTETTDSGKGFFQSYLESCESLEGYKIDLEKQEQKSLEVLEKYYEDVEKQTQQIISLKEEISEKQTRKKVLHNKKLALKKKWEQLAHKRDQIQVYKLVTNTNFYLPSKDITGYSFCPQTKQIVPFDYDKAQYSKEKIVDLLYENVLAVSSSQITEEDIDK